MDRRQLDLLNSFINLPTAPFAESVGLGFIRSFVRQRPALKARADRFGNLLIQYNRGRKLRGARPVLLAAHLDHPGFVAREMRDARTLLASWNGWVRPEFFRNASVRFWHGNGWIRGKVVEIVAGTPDDGLTSRSRPATAAPIRVARASRPNDTSSRPRSPRRLTLPSGRAASESARSFGAESPPESVVVRIARPVPAGTPGMWDFPDGRIRNGRLLARACDDVVGAAAILCMLDTLCRENRPGQCYAFFTRAEEVGFGGALAAVTARTVPRACLVVAIECSKAVTGVTLGAGPVLRVGDRATVFTPAATAFCQVVAEDLARDDPGFRFQRKLMDGGTCESTVYCHYGYEATGLCLPMLNYHNMDLEANRLAPEIVDMGDLENLIKWFVALTRTPRRYDGTHPGLHDRLDALLRRHRPVLLETASQVGG